MVEELDKRKFPITSAFWYLVADAEEYRLYLVTPELAREGRLKTYERLRKLLADIATAVPFERVTIAKPSDDLPKTLAVAIKTGRGLSGIRFSRSTINGVYVPDAYIYRST